MGEPLEDASSAGGVGSNIYFCHGTCKRQVFGDSFCAYCVTAKLRAGIACGQDELAVEEIGTALHEAMHVYDDDEFEVSDSSDLGEVSDLPLSPNSNSTDDLMHAKDEVLISSPVIPDGSVTGSSSGKSYDGKSSTNGGPNLVSAMKGSRAKRGIISKLTVKWAPDVYDPPVTSEPHAMKMYQKCTSKGHYKHKSSKSSSSRRSGSTKDKKRSNNSSGNKREKNPPYSSRRCDANDLSYLKMVSAGSGFGSASLKLSAPVQAADISGHLKCSTSYCKEQPLTALSRQFSAAHYKGMFSAWS